MSICLTYCMLQREAEPYVKQAETQICARTDGDVYAGDVWVVDCPPYGPYD